MEVYRVHGLLEEGAPAPGAECDCKVVETVDPVRGRERAVVSKKPNLVLPAESVRAILALSTLDGPSPYYRVLVFVDSPTQRRLASVRESDSSLVLVAKGNHYSLGAHSARTPWQLDTGFIDGSVSLTEIFTGPTPVVVLPEFERSLHNQTDAGSEHCDDAREAGQGAQGSSPMWVSGTLRRGERHGLWVTVDHMGELGWIDVFDGGCLTKTVFPHMDEETRTLERLMQGSPGPEGEP